MRPHCSTGYMQHNATDEIAWFVCVSVYLSVGHICAPGKMAELTEMPFVGLTRMGPMY